MKTQRVWLVAAVILTMAIIGGGKAWTFLQNSGTGEGMTAAGMAYVATLTAEQKVASVMDYDTPKRLDWHFIPKPERKGLQIKHMTEDQRKAAFALLKSALSEVGYDKARKIMELEKVLAELEKERKGGPIRDHERYYYTLFGQPTADGRWGLSIEGHHLSLNFVVEKNTVISSTPTFFAANPTEIKPNMAGPFKPGLRVLAKEESIAFELLHSLNDEQRKAAIIAEKSPEEIRAAGESESPAYAADGIGYEKLNADQQKLLKQLVGVYARNVPDDLAHGRIDAIEKAGVEKVYFAWAGADKPGIGHYYRIQGPTFLIELVNTQPDAAGNPASHIHCVWRDPTGDFAIPVAAGG